MNTILNVMSDSEIYMALVPVCVIILAVALYRTFVSNRTPSKD
ncbi:hypothetical protein [Pedobacter immunditicola]